MSKTKVIVFDFDGTLVPSNVYKKNLYWSILEGKINRNLVQEIIDTDYGQCSRKEILSKIFSKAKIDLDIKKYLTNYHIDYKNYLLEVRPMPGFSKLFSYLKKLQAKVCINTANNEQEMKSIIKSKGWSFHFDLVLGAPNSKVENFEKIKDVFSVKSKDICFIGDSQEDLDAAMSLNLEFVTFSSPDSLKIANVKSEIYDLSELINIINPDIKFTNTYVQR